SDFIRAARVGGVLWDAVSRHGGLMPPTVRFAHIQGALPRDFVSSLVLPVGDERVANQVVALAERGEDASDFDRRVGEDVERAYGEHPRTQIYENVHKQSAWAGLVVTQLMERAECQVDCSAFLSRPSDGKFGEHVDLWYNLILQLCGVKRWFVRASKDVEPQVLYTLPGDVLAMSEGVWHRAETPEFHEEFGENDHSLHAQFAVILRDPLPPA
ncbi:MAG TPA: cupin domain-containing protein, partial [Candidatus Saccharimonadales bacterium]|nr:cupin domain-containing protein [Candidatus Saccharimonadales bacterium]